MSKRKYFFLLVLLLGIVAMVIPVTGKALLISVAAVYLFMIFDEWEYSKRNGGVSK